MSESDLPPPPAIAAEIAVRDSLDASIPLREVSREDVARRARLEAYDRSLHARYPRLDQGVAVYTRAKDARSDHLLDIGWTVGMLGLAGVAWGGSRLLPTAVEEPETDRKET